METKKTEEIEEIKKSTSIKFACRIESSGYFGWSKTYYRPIKNKSEKLNYDEFICNKDELIDLIKNDSPYIDAGNTEEYYYVLENEGNEYYPRNITNKLIEKIQKDKNV